MVREISVSTEVMVLNNLPQYVGAFQYFCAARILYTFLDKCDNNYTLYVFRISASHSGGYDDLSSEI
jgi:hypothetical protein